MDYNLRKSVLRALVALLPCSLLAETLTYKGVEFSIRSDPQNAFSSPAKVTVGYKNTTSKPVAVRFVLRLTATNGAVVDVKDGGTRILYPGTTENYDWLPFADEQSVGGRPVLPQSGELVNVQVCPANPPAVWHPGRNYQPFANGDCRQMGHLGPTTLGEKVLSSEQAGVNSARR